MADGSALSGDQRIWISRFTWLVQIRWVALISALILCSLFAYLGIISELNAIIITLIGLIFFNLLSFYALKSNSWAVALNLKLLCFSQILGDILGILVLIHFTGGLANPFLFVLVVPVIVAAIFFQAYWTYLSATVTWGLAALLGLLEGNGVLDHHRLSALGEPLDPEALHARMSAALLSLGAVLFCSAFLVCRVMAAFRKGERSYSHLQSRQQAGSRGRATAVDQRREALAGLSRSIANGIEAPLGIVRARIDALQYSLEDLAGDENSYVGDDLKVVAEKVQQIDRTVGKISAFLKQHASERKPLHLQSLLEETVADFSEPLHEQGIACGLTVANGFSDLNGNKRELKLLFRSIMRNSLEALQNRKGGSIRLRVRPLSRNPDWLAIRIHDNGRGIAPEVQRRIFDPFFSTRSPERGMGLAIAYTIVRNHGGHMRVRSRPPPGTSVMVVLPVTRSRSEVELSN